MFHKNATKFFFTFHSAIFAILISPCSSFAQAVGVGQWQMHLPYRNAIEVAEAGDRIYCATGSAVFYYSKSDNAVTRLSKVTGLSDVGVSAIGYRPAGDMLAIAYSNANLDLVFGSSIVNIPDIKMKSMPGNKKINHIAFINGLAYLSSGFGIVVLDVDKTEIKDTYYVTSAQDEVNQVALFNDTLYAASSVGLFKAPLSNANLSDFNSWLYVSALPSGVYNAMSAGGGKLYANHSNNPADSIDNDTVYVYENNSWSYFDTGLAKTVHRIEYPYSKLIITGKKAVYVYDAEGQLQTTYSNPLDPLHATEDKESNIWIADNYKGLIKNSANWGVYPSGPETNKVYAVAADQGDIWMVSGGKTGSWGNAYIAEGISSYIDNKWSTIDYSQLNSAYDLIKVIVDSNDKDRVFAGSWGNGVVEVYKSKLQTVYRENNTDSALQSATTPGANYIRISGLAFDQAGNLWVTVSEVDHLLCVREPNGSWTSFQFQGLGMGTRVWDVIIDNSDNKWILLPGNGILVFNDNGTIGNKTDDQYIRLINAAGSGNLPNKDVVSIAKDLDGEIWVGTNQGIAVFYSPELIFSGSNFDASQILIEQDGYFQYLLEFESVTAIAVDGANRKWIGTENAGVFLMSADGTGELLHFTKNNSPLLSDNIISIAINQKNGEVFFGTEAGLVSYKSTATAGGEKNENVYAYPNPVREGYSGLIAIKGLVKNASVKITDVSGTLIYSTTALGGQAIWDGKNFEGEKAHSGIYLVFISNDDGSETAVTKIVFIN